jgi:NADH-quinone oxidoreductase subunit J
MPWSSLSPTQLAAGQIALAAILAVAGFAFLLPRPKGRAVKEGIGALIAAIAVFGTWLYTTFGEPMSDAIGSVLFVFFSLGALGFGAVLVVQKNPARGAIAFAFVILSTCGLFLLLAAPFLMAATIIIYAGAIIVTFLFVLMLSHAEGPSNENDRSREPLFGSLAGFAFTGLILFALYLTKIGNDPARVGASENTAPIPEQRLPAGVLTNLERKSLAAAIALLDATDEQLAGDLKPGEDQIRVIDYFESVRSHIESVVGSLSPREGSIRQRLERSPKRSNEPAVLYREDQQVKAILEQARIVREKNDRAADDLSNYLGQGKPDREVVKAGFHKLREEVLLLYGSGELPARNVGNLGYVLYADHLLAIELAGTLLLVATIGAIAIAQRKGAAA